MRFDLTRPCGNCPFRSDKPFHMRPDRVRQILGGERGTAWWPTPSFPCHRSIDYDGLEVPQELIDRFNQRYVVDKKTGCWNWTRALDHYGYGVIGFGPRKAHKTHKAHRLSVEIYFGFTLPQEIDVCHSCDNRKCVAPHHLFLGDNTLNLLDAVAKGRRPKYRALSLAEVDEIRETYKYYSSTCGMQGLSDKYGCSVSHIHRIVSLQARVLPKKDDLQQCAGVMAILHREGRPNDAMQIAERLRLWNPATLDPTAPFYKSTEDAIRGQEAMVRFGDIKSVRQRDYTCPHCGHVEHTRRLYRLHLVHAHSDTDKSKLTSGDRAALSGRAKRIKVTLAGKGKP